LKVVVVTGASKGLGFEISRCALQSGFFVVGISRSETENIKKLQSEYPEQFAFIKQDLGKCEELKMLVKRIEKSYGRIFGLVNNAALGHDGVLATMHETQIEELIRVNITSPITLSKYASRSMLLNRTGRIINVGSIIGSTGFNGLSVYGATKSALEGFTRSLSRELGKAQITVNTLAPGYMQTDMTSGLQGKKLESILRRSPLNKLATVEDAAAMACFLLSDSAESITGATFTVDAGSTA
jgi:3-oxoacyl-[acyl-carrier protein] reductase